jgi:hypothetical protein
MIVPMTLDAIPAGRRRGDAEANAGLARACTLLQIEDW